MESLPVLDDEDWAMPLQGRDHPVYATYSLILATFLGTMGLPHVLVRFYTNPDGRAARRTTLVVLALLGAFYLLPAVYGALGRLYTPELLMTGRTDAVVLTLPGRLVGGTLGELLTALVAAGAFAAFLSTSSGLTVSVAGVIGQDILRRRGALVPHRHGARRDRRRWSSRSRPGRSRSPTWWGWRSRSPPRRSARCSCSASGGGGSPRPGAMAGLLVGGGLAGAAVLATILGGPYDGWTGRCSPSRPRGRCRSRSS